MVNTIRWVSLSHHLKIWTLQQVLRRTISPHSTVFTYLCVVGCFTEFCSYAWSVILIPFKSSYPPIHLYKYAMTMTAGCKAAHLSQKQSAALAGRVAAFREVWKYQVPVRTRRSTCDWNVEECFPKLLPWKPNNLQYTPRSLLKCNTKSTSF